MKYLVAILFIINVTASNKLEEVSDDDILQSIKSNEYVIVLFSKYFQILS